MAELLTPTTVFKCLADDTRVRLMLLIAREEELCVCELTCALGENQPKVSRHLAQLRSGGLLAFGVLFAVNSSLHSYLIVSYAQEDGVSLDVGFYYMSNALGRLLGTLLSGWVFQGWGLAACLWLSSAFVLLAALISLGLPRHRA